MTDAPIKAPNIASMDTPVPVPFPAIAIAWGDNENEGVNVKLITGDDMFEMSDLFEGWFAVRQVTNQADLLSFLTTQQADYLASIGTTVDPEADDDEPDDGPFGDDSAPEGFDEVSQATIPRD